MTILHFRIFDSTFVIKDREILSRHFRVRDYRINNASPAAYFFALVRLFFFLLRNGNKYDAYFIRFADWHAAIIAFFGRLYRRKFFIVIGGFDVAAIPRYGYGAHLKGFRSRFIRYAMNRAACLLPNSLSMVYYENRFIGEGVVRGGIRHFVPGIQTRIEVVHNGYDSARFSCQPGIEKRNMVMTVAVVNRERDFYMKGMDRFIETSVQFAGLEFLAVGISRALIGRMGIIPPPNLRILEYTGTEELIRLYSEAAVFCLFSLSEGSPNALCEAMLCECIPVGTDVTSIPEIIGDTGFVIKKNAKEAFTENVRAALEADRQLGMSARRRIIAYYSLEQREERLVSILTDSASVM
ncbi:MAG TPA: glycosyltransferase [Bacteroides sp.]|nr:glycosyltransferase [Bacteroides sp.]